jgi:dienelactone hydrolase
MKLLEQSLRIPVGSVTLDADVVVPDPARGAVLFAHGSGSSRHSPRNRYVAGELQASGLATVLADLLTSAEDSLDAQTGELRFDIGLLADRVTALADWAVQYQPLAGHKLGLFGASTGAAAALVAAANRPDTVAAIVSRGGRADLAGDYLQSVKQATLLIVGGLDTVVIELNRAAMQHLGGAAQLDIVPGASHLFEERGTLEQVAGLARRWFTVHLVPQSGTSAPVTQPC